MKNFGVKNIEKMQSDIIKEIENKKEYSSDFHNNSADNIKKNYFMKIKVVNEEVVKLKCKHLFHFKCLDKGIENKQVCPFCRNEINNDDNKKENQKNKKMKFRKISFI